MSSIHPDLPNLFEFDSPIAPAALSGPGVGVHVTEDVFGRMGSVPIQRFTLGNAKVTVQVISLGAIITAIRMPDKDGKEEDVVLGYDSPDGYLSADNPYFGATVGRVANRIANASFTLDGKEYKLHANAGQNTLHGGLRGWDKAVWNASRHVDGVTFSLLSPDGDEGFPGAVLAQVTYRLTVDSRLMINMQAIATKPTPVNIVNHAYFNLAGHGAGPQEVYKTRLAVNGDRYTVLDQFQIPTGSVSNLACFPQTPLGCLDGSHVVFAVLAVHSVLTVHAVHAMLSLFKPCSPDPPWCPGWKALHLLSRMFLCFKCTNNSS